jgi:hypothetical protein
MTYFSGQKVLRKALVSDLHVVMAYHNLTVLAIVRQDMADLVL